MEEKKSENKGIEAISFMVEVLGHDISDRLYIVRVNGPQGVGVAFMGNLEEFYKFVKSL